MVHFIFSLVLDLVPLVLLFIYNHPWCNLMRSEWTPVTPVLFVTAISHERGAQQKTPKVIVVFKVPNNTERVFVCLPILL